MKALTFLLLCATLTLLFTGCATTDTPDNISERPWNDQKGWEHGLPSTINEGR
jgi:hypothetical protein